MKVNKIIECLSCDKEIISQNLKRHNKSKSHLKNVDKKVASMKCDIKKD